MNALVGWTQDALEAELRLAQADYVAGKQIIENRSGDVSKTEKIESSALDRIRTILLALNQLDPVTYPRSMIQLNNHTRAVFNSTIQYVIQ